MGKRVILTAVDADTGEIRDGIPMLVARRARNGFKGGFFAVANTASELLAKSDLTGVDFRVLWICLSRMSWQNEITIVQKDLAREIGISPTQFSGSLRRLTEMGIIVKHEHGAAKLYRLNPNFGWKGRGRSHCDALAGNLKLTT